MKLQGLENARVPRSFPAFSRNLSIGMRPSLLTKTGAMPPQVWRPGARVSKAHPTEFDTLQPGQQRRKKRRIYGTLTAPVEGETGRFSVRWDDGSTGFGSISGPDKMMHHDSGAGRQASSPLGRASTVARRRQREDAGEEEGDEGEPENPDAENISGGGDHGDDAVDEEGDDDAQGPDSAAAPGQRLRDDQAAISRLAGETETVKGVIWTVVEGVGELDEPSPDILQSTDDDVFAPGITVEREIDAFRHMLWMSIEEMATAINQAAVREGKWKRVSQRELGVWFGLFLGSLQFAEQGRGLWTPKYDTMAKPDFRQYMSRTRFEDIRKHIPATIAKKEAHGSDPWWQLRGGVERFNKKRRALLHTVPVGVLDESMSAWHPRTSKCGGLPHISYVIRKPEPLGTEFKAAADPATGIMLALEIQEGKQAMDAMRARRGDQLGPSTSCVARLVSEISSAPLGYRRIILGDAWFTNVATAVEVARRKPVGSVQDEIGDAANDAETEHWHDHYVGVLKNGHARYPKDYIKSALHGRAAGTQVVLTATVDGVELVAIGWRQSRDSILFFIMTRGASSTRADPSHPHVQRWRDANGNAAERDIPRPQVASLYFKGNNVIDVHNQHRQGTLALEKKWSTQDCWFRLFTTLVGMCTVDAMMMHKHKRFNKRPNEPNEPETKTLTFAAVLAKQLVDNNWDDGEHEATPAVMPPPPPRMSGNSEVWHGAKTAQDSFQTNVGVVACALVKIVDEDNRREGDKRKGCIVCWELEKKIRKSQWACACHQKGVCTPDTGRRCFEIHVGNRLRGSAGEYSEGSNSIGSQGTRRARG